ncbi:hypothetical protein BDV59DRAFT_208695 [Aspergillus ambiguus]|uniref:uncharacterized protein n=1 Tax=Aspergillus ambiguus TaxID=176160 RepID=UPI003CCDF1D1
MHAYGGKGPMTNAVHWVELIIFIVFVGLRLYTRKFILNSIGADDYMVIVALVSTIPAAHVGSSMTDILQILQILYVIFVTMSTAYGLGRLFADVGDPMTYFTAVKYELFSQVAGIMVIGVGKLAVGLFLLRIVRNRVQVWVIRGFLAATTFISVFASICVIVQCIPVQKSWNRMAPGTCWLDFSKVGFTVGSWFVVDDFSFAILPWFIVWDLNMKRKEKFTVAGALSLGVFAGICGIVRTVALGGLNASEYIYDTVPMLLWSSTESTVTIMCSSIAVLRPLYVRVRYGTDGKNSSGKDSYKMPMYDSGRKFDKHTFSGLEDSVIEPNTVSEPKPPMNYHTSNKSDDSIIRGAAGIARTDEISVSYEGFSKV